jgi:hypothetical protein
MKQDTPWEGQTEQEKDVFPDCGTSGFFATETQTHGEKQAVHAFSVPP